MPHEATGYISDMRVQTTGPQRLREIKDMTKIRKHEATASFSWLLQDYVPMSQIEHCC